VKTLLAQAGQGCILPVLPPLLQDGGESASEYADEESLSSRSDSEPTVVEAAYNLSVYINMLWQLSPWIQREQEQQKPDSVNDRGNSPSQKYSQQIVSTYIDAFRGAEASCGEEDQWLINRLGQTYVAHLKNLLVLMGKPLQIPSGLEFNQTIIKRLQDGAEAFDSNFFRGVLKPTEDKKESECLFCGTRSTAFADDPIISR